ncbi:MAG: hypothetical protein K1X74_16670 [Pirellulales bacterium]|nr:hypothetical protein [Pirellulales bacterium]
MKLRLQIDELVWRDVPPRWRDAQALRTALAAALHERLPSAAPTLQSSTNEMARVDSALSWPDIAGQIAERILSVPSADLASKVLS